MRYSALGATAGATALLAVTSVGADARDIAGHVRASGSLVVAWKGDAARGCAAAGLCGYSGSVRVVGGGPRREYYFSVSRGRLRGESSIIGVRTAPVVRVLRTDGSGVVSGKCSDRADNPFVYFGTHRAPVRGRAKFELEAIGLSTARCAGPSPLYRVMERLPALTVSLKHATKARTTLDFSGRAEYRSGRFSGTVRSTLKFHLSRGPAISRRPAAQPARKPLLHLVDFSALYKITGYSGTFSTSFGGLTGPPCAGIDACGLSGSTEWRVGTHVGEVLIEGVALARRSDHGVRGAIAALQRPNARVETYAAMPYADGTTTVDVARPGDVPCHDSTRVGAPGFGAGVGRKPLRIVVGGVEAEGSDGDLVRAGCPGPRDADVFGRRIIASGRLRLSSLSRRFIALRLAGGRNFSGPVYSGEWRSSFKIRLKRVSIHAKYYRSRYLLRPRPPAR